MQRDMYVMIGCACHTLPKHKMQHGVTALKDAEHTLQSAEAKAHSVIAIVSCKLCMFQASYDV